MGIMFCKKQLREAIVAFKKVLAGDEAWLKVLDELELLNEFEEDPDLSDEYSDCEKDEGDNNNNNNKRFIPRQYPTVQRRLQEKKKKKKKT